MSTKITNADGEDNLNYNCKMCGDSAQGSFKEITERTKRCIPCHTLDVTVPFIKEVNKEKHKHKPSSYNIGKNSDGGLSRQPLKKHKKVPKELVAHCIKCGTPRNRWWMDCDNEDCDEKDYKYYEVRK